ncbi:MAG: ATP-dependent DNA helicase RecG [Candidatus Daviesbacteria bacterium]|nr:ATP-dependent DNA helicase RecG [Candidatus Daviesbacteria bacterium]
MDLSTKLSTLSGIGPSLSERLARLNILTIEDLINHYPVRYDDFSNVSNVLDAQIGEKVTLIGEIWSIKNIYTRSHKIITQAIFNDSNSPVDLTWFNSPWLTKSIQTGDRLQVSGKLSKYKNRMSIVAPQWKKIPPSSWLDQDQDSGVLRADALSPQNDTNGHNLIPVYPETFGLTSKWLNSKIATLLPLTTIEDPLPANIKGSMLDLNDALTKIHSPKSWEEANQARARLAFDELFYIQLATLKTRQDWQKKQSVEKFKINQTRLKEFIKKIPFKLTNAQARVLDEILTDLQKGVAMNRLVQGEVGSGKTIVAAIVAFITHLNGFKTIFMAPTEILAFQHFSTLTNLLTPFGINVGIYTGSKKHLTFNNEHLAIKKMSNAKSQMPNVIVGTHALLSNKLLTENVGLVIIDEQQRFGVEQRSLLRSKATRPSADGGKIPHFLTMTATPIPRTVALTIYGDLDISVINEMPKGRLRVKTFVVPNKKRPDSYKFIAKKVKEGDQVYIITPLIELSETSKSAKAAKDEYEKLKKVFPDLKLGLLHGRLKAREKEAAINSFKERKIDILVSTSVVEVGMDIPNATIMVIEGAERFGLAQLHQLRGRVGRGSKESFCFLFTEDLNATNRLKNLEKIYDGLKLSELDLKIRGSGEIFGIRQSGRFEFKLASFSDLTLIEKTRSAAQKILQDNPTLDNYPQLKAKLEGLTAQAMPD